MAISKQPSGKWKCRLQIPTSGRNASGGMIYRGVQKTFVTKGAADHVNGSNGS